uniref:Uncharacterized protein n=1 Tax=Romanomermis culicivorax TaxID=13658 RepID=A0A915JC98_ROMCU
MTNKAERAHQKSLGVPRNNTGSRINDIMTTMLQKLMLKSNQSCNKRDIFWDDKIKKAIAAPNIEQWTQA